MKTLQALKLLQHETKAEVFLVGAFVLEFLRNKKSKDISVIVRRTEKRTIVNFLKKYGQYRYITPPGCGTGEIILFKAFGDVTKVRISLPKRSKNQIYNKNNTLRQDGVYRGFKINALYLPINFKSKKDVIDHVGGLKDIRRRTISCVTSCSNCFSMSGIRLIEAVSLAATTGYAIDKSVLNGIKTYKDGLKAASPDDIRKEFNKILLSKKPSVYIRLMQELGLLNCFIPELSRCVGVTQNKRYHKYDVFTHNILTCDNIEADIVLRLAAVLHDVGKVDVRKIIGNKVTFHKHEISSVKRAATFLSRLQYDGTTKEAVLSLVRMHMYHYTREFTDMAVKRFIKRVAINEEDIKDLGELCLFKLRSAERLGNGLKKEPVTQRQRDFEDRIVKVFENACDDGVKNLEINGHVIMKIFDVPAGKETSEILHYLTERVSRNEKLNNRMDLVQLVLQYLKSAEHYEEIKKIR